MRVWEHRSEPEGLLLRIESPIRRLYAQEHSQPHPIPLTFVERQDGWVELRFESLALFASAKISRFDVLCEVEEHPGVLDSLFFPNWNNIPIWQRYFGREEDRVQLYVSRKGTLSLVARDPLQTDNSEKYFRHEHKIDRLELTKNRLRVGVELTIAEPGEFIAAQVDLVKLESGQVTSRRTAATNSSAKVAGLRVDATIELENEGQLQPFRYGLFLTLHELKSDRRISLRIDHMSQNLYEKLYDGILPPRAKLRGEKVLALATNSRSTRVGFIVQPVNAMDRSPARQRAYAMAARGVAYARRKLGGAARPVALIFEKRASTAQDNGYAFFLHLLRVKELGEAVPFDFYFVIDDASPQAQRVSGLPNVLSKHSFAVWKLLATPGTFTVSSDARFHLADQFAQPDLLNKYLTMRQNYFLQHGVLALKKVGLLSPGHSMRPDAMVVSTEWERQAVVASGYPADRIDLTGLPRWDRLQESTRSRTLSEDKLVLFMPTWRPWLEGLSAEDVLRSVYFQSIWGVLESPELERILTEQGARLAMLPHPLLKEALSSVEFSSERVTMLQEDSVEIAEVLQQSTILITDYSSIVWDFVQMGKLALLFQFDQQRYDAEVGSFTTTGVKSALNKLSYSHTSSALLQDLEGLLNLPGAAHTVLGEELRGQLFPFADRSNSQRVLDAITRRLPSLVKTNQKLNYDQADSNYRKQVKAAAQANSSTSSQPFSRASGQAQPGQHAMVGTRLTSVRDARANIRDVATRLLSGSGIPYFFVPDETGHDGTLAIEARDWPKLIWAVRSRGEVEGVEVSSGLVAKRGQRPAFAPSSSVDSRAFAWNQVLLALAEETPGSTAAPVSCRIEKWTRDADRMLEPTVRNTRTSAIGESQQELSEVRIDGQRFPSYQVLSRRGPFQLHEPVDIVYMWVDGSDPKWLAKQRRVVESLTGVVLPDSTDSARFRDNGELKYSMRSVFAYCPWVRNVILVTDAQIPDWLDVSHPRVRVVDHTELFGAEGQLPTFNSHAIGSRIHRISGLSERYLIVNDDVFFGKELEAEAFFLANGMTKFFLSKSTLPYGTSEPPAHESARRNVVALLEEQFGVSPSRNFFHTPVPQSKELMLSLEAKYPEIFMKTWSHQLRSSEDYEINGWLHHYFGYLDRKTLPGRIVYDYFSTDDPNLGRRLESLLASKNVETFCINDAPGASELDLAYVADWLERYFPVPAPWELPAGG